MVTFASVLMGCFALAFMLVLHTAFWRRFYHVEDTAPEVHRIRCADGAALGVSRRPGVSALAGHPIVICSGIATNHRFVDLFRSASMAQYLNKLGFDVWCMDYRGTGVLSRPLPLTTQGWKIQFEDIVDLDAPAVIEHVRARTGAAQVHWIGFSLGGMIGAAFAQSEGGRDALASLSVVGSPGRIMATPLQKIVSSAASVILLPYVPLGFLARFISPFASGLLLDPIFANYANLKPQTARRAMAMGVDNIPQALAAQGARWVARGDILAVRDDRNFTEGMTRIETPLLAIAGDVDQIAPPAAVRVIYDNASSEKKAYVHLGGPEGEGSEAPPYGHLDLVLGRRSPRDVFDRIAQWIADVSEIELEGVADAEGVDVEPVADSPAAPARTVQLDEALMDIEAGALEGYGDPEPAQAEPEAVEEVAEETVEAPEEEEEVVEEAVVEAEPDLLEPESDAVASEPEPEEAVQAVAAESEVVVVPAVALARPKVEAIASRLMKARKEGRSLTGSGRRRALRETEVRRSSPPGWNTASADGQRRPRPERLHRAPVSNASLSDALKLSAQRARDVLDPDDDLDG